MTKGVVLGKRYRLAERLATGGMGEVWRATDVILGRQVAVKLLRRELVADETARARFRAEARFAAALQHPGIAQVYDYGEHGPSAKDQNQNRRYDAERHERTYEARESAEEGSPGADAEPTPQSDSTDQDTSRTHAEKDTQASHDKSDASGTYDDKDALGTYGNKTAETYDAPGSDDEHVYLVMELVPGEPLSAVLRRTAPLSPDATLDIVIQAARALHAAHRAGIVHRDIKPGNLLITPDGQVKITDFGIARAMDQAAASVTGTGMVMGTAQYVSPEQASGLTVGPATDLYSLGVVAFECLAGTPPFTAETPVAIALQHVRDAPPELDDDIPEPVRGLIADLLAKEPADRPASARSLADRAVVLRESLMLSAVDGPSAVESPAAMALTPAKYPQDEEHDNEQDEGAGRRSALFFTSMAVGILLLGVIVVGSLWRMPQHSGGLNGNTAGQPGPSGSGGAATQPARPNTRPVSGPSGERPTPWVSGSTSPSPRASSSSKANPTPSSKSPISTPGSESPPPHTATPTSSTTPTSSPPPSSSSSPVGGLGSDSKV